MAFGSSRNTGNTGRNSRGNVLHVIWKRRVVFFLAALLLACTWYRWLQQHMIADVTSNDVYQPTDLTIHYNEACDANMENVKKVWSAIDTTLSEKYPSKRISGGIFLYPRQAALLATLVKAMAHRMVNHQRPATESMTVCETGFGSGHSLALFLQASSSLSIRTVSFDKFDRPYQIPLWKWLNQTHPQHHLDYVAGDSCQTVPAVLNGTLAPNSSMPTTQPQPIHCDILHGSSLCPTDNIDLVEHAPCGALLTSTAMATLEDPAVYFGKPAQWRKLRRRQCITKPICFQEAPKELDRNFFFAQQGAAYSSRFCIAMTTGKCSKTPTSCDKDLYRVVSELNLNRLCPQYQVPVPR